MGFAPHVSLINHHLWALIHDGFSSLLRNLDFHEIKASHVQGIHGRGFPGRYFLGRSSYNLYFVFQWSVWICNLPSIPATVKTLGSLSAEPVLPFFLVMIASLGGELLITSPTGVLPGEKARKLPIPSPGQHLRAVFLWKSTSRKANSESTWKWTVGRRSFHFGKAYFWACGMLCPTASFLFWTCGIPIFLVLKLPRPETLPSWKLTCPLQRWLGRCFSFSKSSGYVSFLEGNMAGWKSTEFDRRYIFKMVGFLS